MGEIAPFPGPAPRQPLPMRGACRRWGPVHAGGVSALGAPLCWEHTGSHRAKTESFWGSGFSAQHGPPSLTVLRVSVCLFGPAS